MKIFMSYAHEDRENVGEIKRLLINNHGFDVFVAHDDVAVSSEWMRVIISELEACDVFIPFLTRRFERSKWTDQETGYALAKGIKIIPVSAGIDPYGFIQPLQALLYRDPTDACNRIMMALVETPELKDRVLDSIIEIFGARNTFDDAADRLDYLMRFEEKISARQKNVILKHAGTNNQIYLGRRPRNRVNKFIDSNIRDLDERLITRFRSKY